MNLDHMCAVALSNVRQAIEQAARRELQEHVRLFAIPKMPAGRIGNQNTLRDASHNSRPGAAYGFGGRGLPSIW